MTDKDARLNVSADSSQYVPQHTGWAEPGSRFVSGLQPLRVAILVDGGFYLRQSRVHIGKLSAPEQANSLLRYCAEHIPPGFRLYRIFYYDCPPSSKKAFHPLLAKTVDLSKTASCEWHRQFHNELRITDRVAVRMGELLDSQSEYILKKKSARELFTRKRNLDSLTLEDFVLDITQKGVDMRIGLDIATLAHKKLVDRIVLIGGDSDIVPAAKHARREGLEFVLDPMGHPITSSLREHIYVLEDLSDRLTPDLKF